MTSDTHHCIIEKHFRDKDESIKLEKTRKREMDEALKDRKKYCLYPSGLVAKVKLWDAIKVEKMKNEGGVGGLKTSVLQRKYFPKNFYSTLHIGPFILYIDGFPYSRQ